LAKKTIDDIVKDDMMKDAPRQMPKEMPKEMPPMRSQGGIVEKAPSGSIEEQIMETRRKDYPVNSIVSGSCWNCKRSVVNYTVKRAGIICDKCGL